MAHNRNRFGRPIQGSRNQILTITMTAIDAVGIRHRMIQMMVEVVTLHQRRRNKGESSQNHYHKKRNFVSPSQRHSSRRRVPFAL
jgi:hypothetical protein